MSHDIKELFADCGVCPKTGHPIRLCYNLFEGPVRTHTDAASPVPTILLIMGLASPAPLWDDKFCHALASKGACRVIRFDNRDIGLSSRLDGEPHAGPPSSSSPSSGERQRPQQSHRSNADVFSTGSIMKLAYATLQPGRRIVEEVYSLQEMALDALRLLEALGVRANVHLVGMSLGGMIAQEMALQKPWLVASLTLIATRSANPKKSTWPSMKEMVGFLGLVPRGSVSAKYAPRIAAATTQAEKDQLRRERDAERAKLYGRAFAKFVKKIAGDSRKFPFDEERCAYQMERVFLRSAYMGGCRRQFLVLLNAQSRDADIEQTIACTEGGGGGGGGGASAGRTYIPTVIIHGTRDPLCPVDNGRYLHRLYANSTYHEIDGLGHILCPAMRNQFVSWIWGNISRGEAAYKARPPPAVAGKASAATTPARQVQSKL